AVKMHFDFVLEMLREGLALPVSRGVAPGEGGEVNQRRRIDAARIELGWFRRGKIDPVGDVPPALGEIVLAVIDDGAREQLRQKQSRTQPVMPHDEIGTQIRPGANGLEYSLAQLQMTPKSLRPGRQALFAELLRQRQTLDLQSLEHFHRRSRT